MDVHAEPRQIHNDTSFLYRFPDLTAATRLWCESLEYAVTKEVPESATFLTAYDQTVTAMDPAVDIPKHNKIGLLAKICIHNHGRLSRRKRVLLPYLT